MQEQAHGIYADIAEVKEVRVTECNRLLSEGWVLLGIYPFTTVADMGPQAEEGSSRRQDPTRYARRLIVYVVGRTRQSSSATQQENQ
jgi:hypothetical protein